ncbi:rhodanese-like domain-containing protein [Nocardioides pinisoli]|uniref:Rhodanese-like domain-containing protein n=1 Tax=Nocardioides pinisoli TaxID=2950279 RepID=A0ABT1KS98_9ACTN|nr:rhodanese-like domain-containing protein [Nocardioides pinisoli]MCP3420264.1 rhodanese-like domain-containing protein [Nocardioides pinisoli]
METDGSAIARLLEDCQRRLDRVEPADLADVAAAGALVVDVRPVEQRLRDGELPGALVVDRNVLEWRLDPTSPHRLAVADDPDRRIVLVCHEGYSSSLAARTLQQLGLRGATDLAGGFVAWAAYVASSQVTAIEPCVATH